MFEPLFYHFSQFLQVTLNYLSQKFSLFIILGNLRNSLKNQLLADIKYTRISDVKSRTRRLRRSPR